MYLSCFQAVLKLHLVLLSQRVGAEKASSCFLVNHDYDVLVSCSWYSSDRKLPHNNRGRVDEVWISWSSFKFSCHDISPPRYPNYGLRNADAYVLVYDVNSPSSFTFIQLIRFTINTLSHCTNIHSLCNSRDQIAMSRGLTDVPMIVVGNKSDLLRRDMASDKFRHDVINKVKHIIL